jgi:hypothetical protein
MGLEGPEKMGFFEVRLWIKRSTKIGTKIEPKPLPICLVKAKNHYFDGFVTSANERRPIRLLPSLIPACVHSLFHHPIVADMPFDVDKAIELRSQCEHFRILVIGRANAGKTTLLKKVCNSLVDPEIFSPSGEQVTLPASFSSNWY